MRDIFFPQFSQFHMTCDMSYYRTFEAFHNERRTVSGKRLTFCREKKNKSKCVETYFNRRADTHFGAVRKKSTTKRKTENRIFFCPFCMADSVKIFKKAIMSLIFSCGRRYYSIIELFIHVCMWNIFFSFPFLFRSSVVFIYWSASCRDSQVKPL